MLERYVKDKNTNYVCMSFQKLKSNSAKQTDQTSWYIFYLNPNPTDKTLVNSYVCVLLHFVLRVKLSIVFQNVSQICQNFILFFTLRTNGAK